MTQADDDSVIEFPCEFPIKIMGRAEADFKSHVRTIVDNNIAPQDFIGLRERESSKQRFISVTVTIRAQSRAQLDQLYRELTGDERILYVL